jgi:hypothetical protein
MAPMALATFSDVEAVGGAIEAADRERTRKLIMMVSAVVRRYTGQDFDHVVDDVVVLHPHDGVVRLPQHPVTAISSLKRHGITIAPSTYEWTENGYIRRIWPLGFVDDDSPWGDVYDALGLCVIEPLWEPTQLTAVYSHGYTESPPDVALVVAERVATLIAFGALNVQSESIDGYSMHYQKPVKLGAWTPEHLSILNTYRRSTFASVRLT